MKRLFLLAVFALALLAPAAAQTSLTEGSIGYPPVATLDGMPVPYDFLNTFGFVDFTFQSQRYTLIATLLGENTDPYWGSKGARFKMELGQYNYDLGNKKVELFECVPKTTDKEANAVPMVSFPQNVSISDTITCYEPGAGPSTTTPHVAATIIVTGVRPSSNLVMVNIRFRDNVWRNSWLDTAFYNVEPSVERFPEEYYKKAAVSQIFPAMEVPLGGHVVFKKDPRLFNLVAGNAQTGSLGTPQVPFSVYTAILDASGRTTNEALLECARRDRPTDWQNTVSLDTTTEKGSIMDCRSAGGSPMISINFRGIDSDGKNAYIRINYPYTGPVGPAVFTSSWSPYFEDVQVRTAPVDSSPFVPAEPSTSPTTSSTSGTATSSGAGSIASNVEPPADSPLNVFVADLAENSVGFYGGGWNVGVRLFRSEYVLHFENVNTDPQKATGDLRVSKDGAFIDCTPESNSFGIVGTIVGGAWSIVSYPFRDNTPTVSAPKHSVPFEILRRGQSQKLVCGDVEVELVDYLPTDSTVGVVSGEIMGGVADNPRAVAFASAPKVAFLLRIGSQVIDTGDIAAKYRPTKPARVIYLRGGLPYGLSQVPVNFSGEGMPVPQHSVSFDTFDDHHYFIQVGSPSTRTIAPASTLNWAEVTSTASFSVTENGEQLDCRPDFWAPGKAAELTKYLPNGEYTVCYDNGTPRLFLYFVGVDAGGLAYIRIGYPYQQYATPDQLISSWEHQQSGETPTFANRLFGANAQPWFSGMPKPPSVEPPEPTEPPVDSNAPMYTNQVLETLKGWGDSVKGYYKDTTQWAAGETLWLELDYTANLKKLQEEHPNVNIVHVKDGFTLYADAAHKAEIPVQKKSAIITEDGNQNHILYLGFSQSILQKARDYLSPVGIESAILTDNTNVSYYAVSTITTPDDPPKTLRASFPLKFLPVELDKDFLKESELPPEAN